MTYASGNYYEGDWVKDMKDGKGSMFWLNVREKY